MVTCFGEEVDERVRLAALEQLHQLGAVQSAGLEPWTTVQLNNTTNRTKKSNAFIFFINYSTVYKLFTPNVFKKIPNVT